MPGLNAALNLTSAVLLIAGYIFIRWKDVARHKICMLGATATSTLFLVSYIYYHLHHGATRFPGHGAARAAYLAILVSHTILAVVQVPLIYRTLTLAFQNRLDKHRALARITWPIWLYVSLTGVVIYWMLYRVDWI